MARPKMRLWARRGAALAGLLLIAAVWPRTERDLPIEAPPLDADLDAYLLQQEGRYPDLIPGTGKTILWADPEDRTPTPWAVIYLHGFSASRQEISPVPEPHRAAVP